ncbi:MAG: sugar phosphate isomerase/epimerase [bacterium]|nr:sugar phosphate isomerase/epimerase [bacterium]
MITTQYRFPMAIQTVLPENYREDEQCQQHMRTLQDLGFSGVELNMAHPDKFDLVDVSRFLDEFNLRLTMFASGLTAKTYGLSLSSAERDIRQSAVKKCREIIDFVAGTDAGIILGFFKGGPVPNIQAARARFRESIEQLSPHAQEKEVRLIVEATNRYETSVANSLEDTVELIEDLRNPFLRILPDTFHMNIEEADSFAALTKYADYYDSFHISDNNRYFPGFGAINFHDVINFLQEQEYTGCLAIEGNIKTSFSDDVNRSMEYLKPFL